MEYFKEGRILVTLIYVGFNSKVKLTRVVQLVVKAKAT